MEHDGWNYEGAPVDGTDARKFVTLKQGGMMWVGIRAWNGLERRWYNGNEPEQAKVLAWQDMPPPARGFWDHGILRVPKTPNAELCGARSASERTPG